MNAATTPGLTTGFEDLSAGLRAWARGLWRVHVAAVELLIAHRHWLWRSDFDDVALTPGRHVFTGERLVEVDFVAAIEALRAGVLPCSPDERQILLIAASIAEGVGVDLRAACEGLDAASVALAIRAVAAATGAEQAPAPQRGAGK